MHPDILTIPKLSAKRANDRKIAPDYFSSFLSLILIRIGPLIFLMSTGSPFWVMRTSPCFCKVMASSRTADMCARQCPGNNSLAISEGQVLFSGPRSMAIWSMVALISGC